MKKIYVYDIECFYNCFTATFIDKDSDETRVFVIYKDIDQRKQLFEFLRTEVQGLIGFNCLNYDSQILEFLFRNPTVTTKELRNYSDIITSNDRKYPDVSEYYLKIPHLDVYKIHHFDNKNRRTSLKWCEFGMDAINIEDMPDMQESEDYLNSVLKYNLNDVIETKRLYLRTSNMIQLRKELSNMYGINLINASNSKIGSELCLELYCKYTGKNKNDIRSLRTYRDAIPIKDIIFDYIQFKTPLFNKVLNYFKSLTVSDTNEIDYTLKVEGIEYVYGSGGIHASVSSKIFESSDEFVILDLDVASLYPSIAVVNKLYPKHLGIEFTHVYENDIVKVRLAEKAKKENGNKSIIEGFKEASNSVYGKSNDIYSWLYDMQYTLQTTVNGQLLLTMLVERLLEISQLSVIQLNTDGITVYLRRSDLDDYYKICSEWEKETKLTLEFAEYSKMIIRDVNSYIAEYTNGKTKCKGAFEYENIPLHKNKSFSIIPRAVHDYFIKGIPIEDTIYNHKNIFDFCGGVRARSSEVRGNAKFVTYEVVEGKVVEKRLSKTVRYFISKKGATLFKVYSNGTREHVEAPLKKGKQIRDWKVTIFNRYYESNDYNIDYQYYIIKAKELIHSITIPDQLQLL